MTIQKEELIVEETSDKKFKVISHVEEELTAEEIVDRFNQGKDFLDAYNKDIESIPKIREANLKKMEDEEKKLTKERENILFKFNKYQAVEQRARLIAKENELLAKRTGKTEETKAE